MKVRNTRLDCIANIPYSAKPGHDPKPVEVYPGQVVELDDNHFDSEPEEVKQAFVDCLKNGSLELVEAPK